MEVLAHPSEAYPVPSGGHVLTGAHDFSINRATFITVGRDNITNIYPPALGSPDDREEILNWLKGHSYRAIHRSAFDTRTAGTGTWFVESIEFVEFVNGTQVILWATGLPGSGKTILASFSIEYLENKFSSSVGVAIVYAYLRYSEKPSLRDIVAGLLSQLVASHDSACACIQPAYHRCRPLKEDLSSSEAIKLLQDVVARFSQVFVVIDGLDEVDDIVKEGLLQALLSLNVNILITSRPLDLFRERYTPNAFHMSIQARTEDIGLYVAEKIKLSARLAAIVSSNPDVAEQLSSLVKEKSRGMFLLARLQMELVLKRSNSVKSLMKALEGLPSGVDDMYRETLRRINAQPEEDVSIAHRVFIWLLYFLRPIQVEELQHALATSLETLEFDKDDIVPMPLVLSVCGGLVTVETKTNVVRFIHYTTKEYMLTNALHLFKFQDPQVFIAATCAAYAKSTSKGMDEEAARRTSGLLEYTEYYLGEHASACADRKVTHPAITSLFSDYKGIPLLSYTINTPGKTSGRRWSSNPLNLAAARGLSEYIATQNTPYPKGYKLSPFHIAARCGHLEALCSLLSTYVVDEDLTDVNGNTLLHDAVHYGRRSLLPFLLSHESTKGDINTQNNLGVTPLMVACTRGSGGDDALEVAHLLAAHPSIEPNLQDTRGRNMFFYACGHPTDALANMLITIFPNLEVDNCDQLTKRTAFMEACLHGMESVVSWFLSRSRKSDPPFLQQTNTKGKTALQQVLVKRGLNRDEIVPLPIVEILSKHGGCLPDIYTSGKLHGIYGVEQTSDNSVATMEIDLEDVHRRYGQGRTALMLVSEHYSFAVNYLLSRPTIDSACVNSQDDDGRSALMFACFYGNTYAIKALLASPLVDIHLRDHDGLSALEYSLGYIQRQSNPLSFSNAPSILDHPSWNPSSIRKAVFTIVQNEDISAWTFSRLLEHERARGSFKWDLELGDPDTILLVLHAAHRYPSVFLDIVLVHCLISQEPSDVISSRVDRLFL